MGVPFSCSHPTYFGAFCCNQKTKKSCLCMHKETMRNSFEASSIPLDASVPPKEGEYGYYCSRITQPAWAIDNGKLCHYSLSYEKAQQPFVTCHGLIETLRPKVPKNASIPPKEGEYAHYNSRFEGSVWMVATSRSNDRALGCHYSLPYPHIQPFVTCHGMIESVFRCTGIPERFEIQIG